MDDEEERNAAQHSATVLRIERFRRPALPERRPSSYSATLPATLSTGERGIVHVVYDPFLLSGHQEDPSEGDVAGELSPIWWESRARHDDPSTAHFRPVRLIGSWADCVSYEARPSQASCSVHGDTLLVVGGGSVLFPAAITVNLVTGFTRLHRVALTVPRQWYGMSTVVVPARHRARYGDALCFGGGGCDDPRAERHLFAVFMHHHPGPAGPASDDGDDDDGPALDDDDGDDTSPVAVTVERVLLPQAVTAPPGRLYHSAVLVDDRFMYVFGGAPDVKSTTSDDTVFNDLWYFDLDRATWSRVAQRPSAPWPSPRGSYALVGVGHSLFLVGGFNGNTAISDAWHFDMVSQTWSEMLLRFGAHADDGADRIAGLSGRHQLGWWAAGSFFNDASRGIELIGGFDLRRQVTDARWVVHLLPLTLRAAVLGHLLRHLGSDELNALVRQRAPHLINTDAFVDLVGSEDSS